MNNKELPLLGGLVAGPAFLPDADIAACPSFRAAVCLAWRERRIKTMMRAHLAELCELVPQHVSDYLHPADLNAKGQRRRCLPAEKIAAFEATVGNRAITQYLIRQAQLTLLEEMIALRAAA